jgi:hypothetical protein
MTVGISKLSNIRSGTGDRRRVLDGCVRKNSKNTMVATIPTSRMIRTYDHDRAHVLLFRIVVGTCSLS